MEKTSDSDRLLTVADAAERLSLSPWSIYQMASAGLLPVHRTGVKGRTLRISESDLAEYLRGHRTGGTGGSQGSSRKAPV